MRGLRGSRLALVALWTGLGGCVVPAGPEWSDPQGQYPPTIQRATPPMGSVLVPDAGASLTFEVVLADQNTQDKLYVRWIIDYPPYVDGVSRLVPETRLPGGTTVERPVVRFAPNCKDDQIATGISDHRLLLAVSDRPFESGDAAKSTPDLVPEGNYRVEGAWHFTLDCR